MRACGPGDGLLSLSLSYLHGRVDRVFLSVRVGADDGIRGHGLYFEFSVYVLVSGIFPRVVTHTPRSCPPCLVRYFYYFLSLVPRVSWS